MTYAQQRAALLQTMQSLAGSDLSQGTSGNVSIRVAKGFIVTPSAMRAEDCDNSDMVLVSMDGSSNDKRLPSSEWRFHHDIYQHFQAAGAIVHVHAPWCTTLACLHKEIPRFHYMVAMAGGDSIRCTPYATYGTQALSDYVVEALQDRQACLMANHGMVCHAPGLASAMALADGVEWLAQVYCQTLQTGEPQLLSEEQMAAALEKFSAYRSANPN